MGKIHGGRLIARALKAEGVDALFTLTGGHIVPILDGCVEEGIRIVDVRHEETAGHAAEAYTRLTGRLGVAAVTAAPGVTNTVTAVMNAYFSHTPMLVLGGRHLVGQELTGGLQEMDHPPLFRTITKLATTAWETSRLADYIAIAARHAFSGRGGPVFLDVPLDVQSGMVDELTPLPTGYRATEPVGADPVAVEFVANVLATASRPVIFAGNGVRGDGAAALVGVAEALHAPVFTNAGARGSLPHDHSLLGVRTRSLAFDEADVVLALGVDWDFRTGYGQKINPSATVIQVDAEPTRLGWNRPAHHAVVAHPGRFLVQLAGRRTDFAVAGERTWAKQIREAEADKEAAAHEEADAPGDLVMPQFFGRAVGEFFGPDAIVAVDGGDIVATTAKWLQIATPGHVLEPGPAGTLGTGPGFALAAAVVHPEKTVGIVFGDGGFGFNGFEYDSFVRHGLPVIGVVGNDGVWNNIKTFHKMFYPDRVVASDLGRRPYHDVVTALGGHGELVTAPDELVPALERARASGLPALVNVHIAETFRASSNYAS
jgi:acetolactate synthase-1/2/3 large subunit